MPRAGLSVLLLAWGVATACGQTAPSAATATNTGLPPSPVIGDEAMTYGQEQVDQVLKDRPRLADVVHGNNALENELAKEFASAGIDFRLVWESHPTTSGPDNSSESSGFPDAMQRAYITVDGIWKGGSKVGTSRSAEEMLVDLVFEIANARGGRAHAALDQRALRGEIDRESYILQAAHNEFDAWHAVTDFRNQFWLPYCHDTGTADTPAIWRTNFYANFDEWIKKYPRTNWYPWQFYGARYDKAQAYQYKTTLAAAENGDATAQAQMGVMLGSVGLYQDSGTWFLKAAKQGNVSAENAMQWICYYGVGIPKDDAQAFSWAMKAAQQGDVTAEKTVAWHYQWGVGVAADPAAAKTWSDKAAVSH